MNLHSDDSCLSIDMHFTAYYYKCSITVLNLIVTFVECLFFSKQKKIELF